MASERDARRGSCERLEPGDEAGLARARTFALARLFDRVWLHGALEAEALLKRADLRQVVDSPGLLGLAAPLRGAQPYRFVPLSTALPGVASALVADIERPFIALAPAENEAELRRAGGRLLRTEIQMARLRQMPLPVRDERVEPLEDGDELRRFYGRRFAEFQLELGPFFGVRDRRGELVAAGGVSFVTDRIAFLSHVETREDFRRAGLARSVVVELVRELEAPRRTVLLQVREQNQAARALYGALGFRGSRRFWLYAFGDPQEPSGPEA